MRLLFSKQSTVLVIFIFTFAIGHLAEGKEIDWKSCQRKETDNSTIPFDAEGKFYEDCAPEVVYSWKHKGTLEALEMSVAGGKGLVESHFGKMVFAAKSPLSSHAYGDVAVRIKLRKPTKFVLANKESPDGYMGLNRNCSYYKKKYPEEYDNLVIAAYLPFYRGFSEYIICSDKAIESWSYGSKEQYLEMKKEFDYYKANPKAGDHESVKSDQPLTVETSYTCPDNKNCSMKALQERMQTAKSLADNNREVIYYVSSKKENREEHFARTKHYYYTLRTNDIMASKSKKLRSRQQQ